MAYSDDPIGFKRKLLNDMYDGLSRIATTGVARIHKGDFSATYTSLAQLKEAIKNLEMEIHIEDGGCFSVKGVSC